MGRERDEVVTLVNQAYSDSGYSTQALERFNRMRKCLVSEGICPFHLDMLSSNGECDTGTSVPARFSISTGMDEWKMIVYTANP